MEKSVEFFFDVGSPASYLAWTQLPALCTEQNAALIYKPMLLGGVFQATGNASPATIPKKGRYMIKDNERFARRYGVPMRMNPHFPINTLTLMRAVIGIQQREPARFEVFLRAVMTALWVNGENLGDLNQVTQMVTQAGFEPAAIMALVNDPAIKALLKVNTDEAVDRGVFGAPTMFVEAEMFFGQDRLDFVREALRHGTSNHSKAPGEGS